MCFAFATLHTVKSQSCGGPACLAIRTEVPVGGDCTQNVYVSITPRPNYAVLPDQSNQKGNCGTTGALRSLAYSLTQVVLVNTGITFSYINALVTFQGPAGPAGNNCPVNSTEGYSIRWCTVNQNELTPMNEIYNYYVANATASNTINNLTTVLSLSGWTPTATIGSIQISTSAPPSPPAPPGNYSPPYPSPPPHPPNPPPPPSPKPPPPTPHPPQPPPSPPALSLWKFVLYGYQLVISNLNYNAYVMNPFANNFALQSALITAFPVIANNSIFVTDIQTCSTTGVSVYLSIVCIDSTFMTTITNNLRSLSSPSTTTTTFHQQLEFFTGHAQTCFNDQWQCYQVVSTC